VLHELGHDLFEMMPAEDEHPVQAFAPGGPDETLRVGVGLR
jgi:hypothetical protein